MRDFSICLAQSDPEDSASNDRKHIPSNQDQVVYKAKCKY